MAELLILIALVAFFVGVFLIKRKIDQLKYRARESVYNKVEWRNENFELCDGTLKKKLQNASSQKNLMRRN